MKFIFNQKDKHGKSHYQIMSNVNIGSLNMKRVYNHKEIKDDKNF